MNGDRPLSVFFGHHKCASTWINDIVKAVCRELKLNHATVSNSGMFSHNLSQFVAEKQIDFLAYTNADFQHVKQLDNFRGFHVVRDPRDMCVSAYFSHLHSHSTDRWPVLIEHRHKLQNLSEEEGLLLDMEFMARFMNEMNSWDYSVPHVLQLKMEELTRNPYPQFLKIFTHLGLIDTGQFGLKKRIWHALAKRFGFPLKRLPEERMLGIVWEHDFSKLTGGRKRGQEDQKSHYRKGVVGDWRNYFKEEHIKYFKSHYEHILLKLGYEQNSDWV